MLLVSSSVGLAADGGDAATSIDQVDSDFHFLGEFQGSIPTATGSAQLMGVQVYPTGDGSFGGMVYVGGLPGSGWNRTDRETLSGTREGDAVRLTSDSWNVEVDPEGANLSKRDQEGDEQWRLAKLQRFSPTLGMMAPGNAYTLFDGHDVDVFENGEMTEEGWLKEGTQLKPVFRDFTMHVEFRLPYMPAAKGQGRSNSGVYLQSSYEVQVLDSFGLEGVKNECGALYRQRQPDINMCLPPLAWQTYDITFHAPRFDVEGNKTQNARITVLHNGVVIHDNVEVLTKTGAGKQETPKLWPTKFQDHSNPVRFRNIWLIDLEGSLSAPAQQNVCGCLY